MLLLVERIQGFDLSLQCDCYIPCTRSFVTIRLCAGSQVSKAFLFLLYVSQKTCATVIICVCKDQCIPCATVSFWDLVSSCPLADVATAMSVDDVSSSPSNIPIASEQISKAINSCCCSVAVSTNFNVCSGCVYSFSVKCHRVNSATSGTEVMSDSFKCCAVLRILNAMLLGQSSSMLTGLRLGFGRACCRFIRHHQWQHSRLHEPRS